MKSGAKRLLIIDDEENMRHMLSVVTSSAGYMVSLAENGQQGLAIQTKEPFDLILCDLKMPKMDGLEFLETLQQNGMDSTVVMMSAYATIDDAVRAMKAGAYDFITKPFKTDEVLLVLEKALEYDELRRENIRLRAQVKELQGNDGFAGMVAESNEMRRFVGLAKKTAQYGTTVLITGESGTGKELVARGIHLHSGRSDKPFIAVNCGSVPENLLESEFFGYVKGAFTGADQNRKGLFEEADGGTLFLDEIGELPLGLQVKLLRVLQESEVTPVGSVQPRKVDVRLVTATAKDLEEEVVRGDFRQDLFFRLNVVVLELPPLRDRKEDIPFFCKHFLKRFNRRMGLNVKGVSSDAMTLLVAQNWPGNVRELENCLERAMVFVDSQRIEAADLPQFHERKPCGQRIDDFLGTISLKKGKRILEERLIWRVMEATQGNKSQAAKMLEISYPSLLKKIKEMDLENSS